MLEGFKIEWLDLLKGWDISVLLGFFYIEQILKFGKQGAEVIQIFWVVDEFQIKTQEKAVENQMQQFVSLVRIIIFVLQFFDHIVHDAKEIDEFLGECL